LFDGNYNNLSNKPILFDPSSINQSLLPDTDVAYDLGSSTNKWRDLYLSGNTIFLGNAVIRNVDGTVDLPLNAKVNGKKIPLDVADLTDIQNLLGSGGVTSYNDLTDKPTLFSGSYTDLTNKPDLTVYQLSANAFSGSYTDLTNKPTIPADISDLTDLNNVLASSGAGYILPIASASRLGGIKIGTGLSIDETGIVTVTVTGVSDYNELTNKPDLTVYQLAANAFSGSYTDLTNKPTLFSGSYTDLTDKPTIPTVPTNISAFTNDAGYLTSVGTISYNDLSNLPTLFSGSYTDLTDKPTLFSGSYTDLTDKPTLFSGSYTDLTDKPTLFSGSYTDLTDKPDLTVYQLAADAFSGSYTDLTDKPVLFSGSYLDLSNKPFIPSDISDLSDRNNIISASNITENDVFAFSVMIG
jgi:hypothetical protein